jgi:broad specificity phosphatase PhoE
MTESKKAARHSEMSLAVGKNDCDEHMEGMTECEEIMKSRPLVVKCYSVDDPNAPSPITTADNTAKTSTKIVHFVRHGQGFHNLMADLAKEDGKTWEHCIGLSVENPNPYCMEEILDAPLTNKGREQAMILQPTILALHDTQKPQLVVLSPNCRALQTGVIAFDEFVGKVPFHAHEMVREETGVHVCDQRRPKSQQEREFPMVDFSLLLDEEDTLFEKDRRETKIEVTERVYNFLEWLELRDENVVGVASHSAWLLTAFNANFDIVDERLKGWFQTGEMRSVILEFVRT